MAHKKKQHQWLTELLIDQMWIKRLFHHSDMFFYSGSNSSTCFADINRVAVWAFDFTVYKVFVRHWFFFKSRKYHRDMPIYHMQTLATTRNIVGANNVVSCCAMLADVCKRSQQVTTCWVFRWKYKGLWDTLLFIPAKFESWLTILCP